MPEQPTRIHKARSYDGTPFVRVPNELAQNHDLLSSQALGMLVRLLSRPESWIINIETFISEHHGRDAVRAMFDELINARFMVRVPRKEGGRFAGVEYHVFDRRLSLEEINSLTTDGFPGDGETVSGLPDAGEADATKKGEDKEGGCSPDGEQPGVDPDEAASLLKLYEEGRIENEPEPQLLEAEDDSRGKAFPWAQFFAILKRILPELRVNDRAPARDRAIARWWRANGKTASCFETLAEKIKASDYLMARNGHKGNKGKPYPLGWYFEKSLKDNRLKAEHVMEDKYSNENMEWVLQKESKPRTQMESVLIVGESKPKLVNLLEELNGKPRYRKYGVSSTGAQQYWDEAS